VTAEEIVKLKQNFCKRDQSNQILYRIVPIRKEYI
tara:strand:- start:632 stop:736 length:105 start_codon:yes stop_codon:yes gene_type:complete